MFGGGAIRFGGGDSGGGGGGGGLPADPIVVSVKTPGAWTFNRGFSWTDGVTVTGVSTGNLGGTGTGQYFCDTGGGADAALMRTRFIACMNAGITASGSDAAVAAGPAADQVTITPGPSGLLFNTSTAGVVVVP